MSKTKEGRDGGTVPGKGLVGDKGCLEDRVSSLTWVCGRRLKGETSEISSVVPQVNCRCDAGIHYQSASSSLTCSASTPVPRFGKQLVMAQVLGSLSPVLDTQDLACGVPGP